MSKTKISSQQEFDNLPNGTELILKKEGSGWLEKGRSIDVVKDGNHVYEKTDPNKTYKFDLMKSDMSNQMWWDPEFILYATLNYKD